MRKIKLIWGDEITFETKEEEHERLKRIHKEIRIGGENEKMEEKELWERIYEDANRTLSDTHKIVWQFIIYATKIRHIKERMNMTKRKMRFDEVERILGVGSIAIGSKIHCIKHRWMKGYVADLIDSGKYSGDKTECGCPLSNIIVDDLLVAVRMKNKSKYFIGGVEGDQLEPVVDQIVEWAKENNRVSSTIEICEEVAKRLINGGESDE